MLHSLGFKQNDQIYTHIKNLTSVKQLWIVFKLIGRETEVSVISSSTRLDETIPL